MGERQRKHLERWKEIYRRSCRRSPITCLLIIRAYDFRAPDRHLIRQGRSSKEIADVLNLSSRTVETHRRNMRTKLGIKDKKTNLRSYLLTNQHT